MDEQDTFAHRRFVEQDFSGAEFRECELVGTRFVGSVLVDVEIDAYVSGLRINGVEVMPLVEAELDRLHPERLALRPTTPAKAAASIDVVEAFWAPTVAAARSAAPGVVDTRVDDEWSFVETLRHLVFVHDVWIGRSMLGSTAPNEPVGLPASFMDGPELGTDPDASPDLDTVLDLLAVRRQALREHLATVDDLEALLPPAPTAGFPPAEPRSTLACLQVVLNEEWAHHGFARRDLSRLLALPEHSDRPGTDRA